MKLKDLTAPAVVLCGVAAGHYVFSITLTGADPKTYEVRSPLVPPGPTPEAPPLASINLAASTSSLATTSFSFSLDLNAVTDELIAPAPKETKQRPGFYGPTPRSEET